MIGVWEYQNHRKKLKTCRRVCHYEVYKTTYTKAEVLGKEKALPLSDYLPQERFDDPYWIFQPRNENYEVIGMPTVNYKFSTQKERIDFCLDHHIDFNWR